MPCTFVRLTGCNLRCDWCDSEYTFTGGVRMSIDEAVQRVQTLGSAGLVEITGGEPMLQEQEVVALMNLLLAQGYRLLLETSGERPLHKVPSQVHKIIDVKCPGSGEGGSFRLENLSTIGKNDEIKFVIADRRDYEFARAFSEEHHLADMSGGVIFSPAFRKDASGSRDSSHCLLDPQTLAEWILADGLNVRLGIQVHKFIWDPALKGV